MENNKVDEIKEILKQNTQTIEDIQMRLQKIENYLKWQKIWSILKILIIAVPIILSIIYLPPLFKEAFEGYKDLLGPGGL